ncbi:hypothetical protein Ahy_B03g063698 [Arachis hypogaea]|uniref:FAR1 domain-containing protein n=1 Tax=Arachis hypogaea TaxID=3818 RepID=A0A444ZXR6_ARAHY|nr:hypothetical protein Ahy_B03g063698 [Arachis hypogaea]
MESNFIEPISHSPDSFTNCNTIHSSDNFLNTCDVKGEKFNKVSNAIECMDITEFGSDDTDLVDEVWSLVYCYFFVHCICLAEDEIPIVGMQFEDLKLAQEFYATYAKKVGFVCKIRNTNLDRMTKEPINQSIHYNREGFRGSHVKAPTRKNTVAGVGCRARIYAKFDREKKDWVLLKVDLRHSHPCSTKKVLHYHENRESTMHVKCMIEVNDEAGIRPDKTFLALANEVGGPSNLGFFEKDVKNYISARLRSTNINADVKEMLDYLMRMKEMNPNFFYVVNVDDDYKFQSAVWVDVRCRASYEYYGDVVSFDTTYSTNRCYTALVFCSENLFLMRVSVVGWDVQTEFVKKADCNIRAINEQGDLAWVKVEQEILAYEKTLYVTCNVCLNRLTHEVQCECNLFESAGYIQGPSKVNTKGRPKGKRLGYELEKSIKKSMQRKRKSSAPDKRVESCRNIDLDAPAWQISPQGVGGFMSLLNSFDNT